MSPALCRKDHPTAAGTGTRKSDEKVDELDQESTSACNRAKKYVGIIHASQPSKSIGQK